MTIRNIRLATILTGLYALALLTNNAWAEILAAQTYTSPIVYGGASYYVDFNGAAAGGQIINFKTAAPNTRVAFTFNAECAVGNDSFHYLDIDIMVDPSGPAGETAAAPSNSDNAFCSGNDTPSDFLYASGDGWVSAATQATMVIPTAGDHTIRVRVNGSASGVVRLDDMSLIVWR